MRALSDRKGQSLNAQALCITVHTDSDTLSLAKPNAGTAQYLVYPQYPVYQ